MVPGQLEIIKLLSKSEEEFSSLCFFPVTIAIYTISGFENNNRRKIFILLKGIISPVNNFFIHSPPAEML
jgi:hypothetical protein